jgi:hypothetical protein
MPFMGGDSLSHFILMARLWRQRVYHGVIDQYKHYDNQSCAHGNILFVLGDNNLAKPMGVMSAVRGLNTFIQTIYTSTLTEFESRVYRHTLHLKK